MKQNGSFWRKNLKFLIIAVILGLVLLTALIALLIHEGSSSSGRDVKENDTKTTGPELKTPINTYVYEDEDPFNTSRQEDRKPLYIIGVYQEKLAVFETVRETETPYREYDVYISVLPLAEQEKLREGIEVFSEDELYSLIEDYSS